MELEDRLGILIQAAELAQANGVLTLDEAVIVKGTIDLINTGNVSEDCISNLKAIAEKAQARGVYTLKDAYYIYQATDGIEELIG